MHCKRAFFFIGLKSSSSSRVSLITVHEKMRDGRHSYSRLRVILVAVMMTSYIVRTQEHHLDVH